MEMDGQCHAPAALSSERDWVLITQEAGWASGLDWTGAENLAFAGVRIPDRPTGSVVANPAASLCSTK